LAFVILTSRKQKKLSERKIFILAGYYLNRLA